VETDVQHAGPIARRSEAHELFVRVYPAIVGLVRRVLDRPGVDVRSLTDAEQVAVEVMAWARSRRLADSDAAVVRIASRALDRCLERIEGSARRVPLPMGLVVEDLADDDVLDDGARVEWTTAGLRLGELHDALRDAPVRVRHVGVCCLGAGLAPEDVAALLDLRGDETLAALAEVAERLTGQRRSRVAGSS
jgi:DNA-directed RNA polymerase specialized sigma24 family protein